MNGSPPQPQTRSPASTPTQTSLPVRRKQLFMSSAPISAPLSRRVAPQAAQSWRSTICVCSVTPRKACPARSVSSFRRRNPPWRLRRWYAGASLRLSMTDSCRSQTTALPRAPGAPPICRRRRAAGGRGWIMIFRVPYFSTRCC